MYFTGGYMRMITVSLPEVVIIVLKEKAKIKGLSMSSYIRMLLIESQEEKNEK